MEPKTKLIILIPSAIILFIISVFIELAPLQGIIIHVAGLAACILTIINLLKLEGKKDDN